VAYADLSCGAQNTRNLVERLGRFELCAAVTVVAAAFLIERIEGPPVFATFGDSLSWSVVTTTTVGYGDNRWRRVRSPVGPCPA
jgi:hypothetical protein